MTNDQSPALLTHVADACGCAVCQCGDDCTCASAQADAAVCDACKEAGCGCGA
jgi:hypothetical protein